MTRLTRDYPRPGTRRGWLLCPVPCPPGSLSSPYFIEKKDVPGSSSIFPALETSHFFGEDQIILGGNDDKKRLLDGLIATKTLLLWGFLSGQARCVHLPVPTCARAHTWMPSSGSNFIQTPVYISIWTMITKFPQTESLWWNLKFQTWARFIWTPLTRAHA